MSARKDLLWLVVNKLALLKKMENINTLVDIFQEFLKTEVMWKLHIASNALGINLDVVQVF